MDIDEDRASDRRFGVALAGVLVAEVILAGAADAGVIALWLWLVLAILVVLVAGAAMAWVQHRSEGTPLVAHRHRRQSDDS